MACTTIIEGLREGANPLRFATGMTFSAQVAVRPNNTFNLSADLEGEWQRDLPSQQQYPRFWCKAKESDGHPAKWCPVCRCRIRDGWCAPGCRGVHIWQWIYCDDLILPILSGNCVG